MTLGDLLLTFLSAFLGALASLAISRSYYRKSGQELKSEADRLYGATMLVVRGLHASGLVQFTKDENGNFVGVVQQISGTTAGTSDAAGTLTRVPIPTELQEIVGRIQEENSRTADVFTAQVHRTGHVGEEASTSDTYTARLGTTEKERSAE